jgi:hypothetical protein
MYVGTFSDKSVVRDFSFPPRPIHLIDLHLISEILAAGIIYGDPKHGFLNSVSVQEELLYLSLVLSGVINRKSKPEHDMTGKYRNAISRQLYHLSGLHLLTLTFVTQIT